MRKLDKKAFTLIELIVTIAVLGILVLLASPRFFGHTQNAELTKGFANAKSIEKASELYYMDHEDWPRLTDDPYTSEEIKSYSERIFDRPGHEANLDTEGNYYDIDYDKLSDYIQVPDDKKNYILQNPVGKVFYMDNLNETGKSRVDYSNAKEEDNNDNDNDEIVIPGPQPSNPLDISDQKGEYRFHGEVAAKDFITGTALAKAIGLTAGEARFYPNEPEQWLKFTKHNKTTGKLESTIFVAKKPLRYYLSWDSINDVGAVFGNKDKTSALEIGGQTYKVRLLSGATKNPAKGTEDRDAQGSEWNKMMLPIHEQAVNGNWAYPAYVENNIARISHNLGSGQGGMYNDKDLLTHHTYGNGSSSLTQETSGIFRVRRGYNGVSNSGTYHSNAPHNSLGWRPALELVVPD